MITTIIYSIIILLIIMIILFMYLGIKFIRNRHYAIVPNQETNNINDVYIQFL
jgi:hypothetical protein